MPELPEVETIVRSLREGAGPGPSLPGEVIESVTLHWPRHIAYPSAGAFRRRIRGQRIQDVQRRGKYLVFPLEGHTLILHLKMSGDLVLVPQTDPRHGYEHTLFHLVGGWDLRFRDSRKFGRVYLVDDPGEVLGGLGPEPLDAAFNPTALAERLGRRKRALKPLLLDQGFLAGVGNIYADEALHRAGLHPLKRSHELTPDEVSRLWSSIRSALRQGIRKNGASIDWVYRGGEFQNHFRVYQRAGEPCPVCGTAIERIVISQRSTHFCPRCQPESVS